MRGWRLRPGIAVPAVSGKLISEVFPEVPLKRLTSAIKVGVSSGAPIILTHSLNPSLLPLKTRSGPYATA